MTHSTMLEKKKSFLGIEVTLDNMPDNGAILLFTDAGTHQRNLEASIKKKAADKNIKIFIVFYPKCRSKNHCDASMPSYISVSEGRIFNQTDIESENFFNSVLSTVRNALRTKNRVKWKKITSGQTSSSSSSRSSHKLFRSLKVHLYRCKTHVKMKQQQQQQK